MFYKTKQYFNNIISKSQYNINKIISEKNDQNM